MALETVKAVVEALRSSDLLKPALLAEALQLSTTFSNSKSDTQEYARTLIRAKILNLYQAKKVLAGKIDELRIGHYIVLDKLGEGGMGKVYKALQLNLDRVVALKVVRSSLLKNETALKRFRREVKSAAQLSHPNIVRVFDADQDGDRHYLAMECIDGTDLSKLVKDNGPLPVHVACSYIRQAALGLQHAHDQGLVHRDIKPSNLLVVAGENRVYGPRNTVKILDMGLARSTTEEGSDPLSTELTRTGTVIGTPDYMSPEQAKNSSAVDHRSDLYSLGCTFYHLLTGEVVFPNGNPLEKLLQHQMDAPRPIQLVRMDTPVEVATIVQSLLAKKPDHRFQSGAALAHALEPWCTIKGGSDLHPTQILAAEAVDPSSMTIETKPGSPFDFEDLTTTPPQGTRKGPITQKRPAMPAVTLEQEPPSSSSWGIYIGGILAGLVLLAITIGLLNRGKKDENTTPDLSDSGSMKNETKVEPKTKSETKVETKPKKDPPREMDVVERFIPNATIGMMVFDLETIRSMAILRDRYLPEFSRRFQENLGPLGVELFVQSERVVLANVIRDDDTVNIFQGKRLVTTKLLEMARKLEDVRISRRSEDEPELFEFHYPMEGDHRRPLFAAAIDASVVVSRNRDLVLEAIDKRDGGTARTRLQDGSLLNSMEIPVFSKDGFTPIRAYLGLRSSMLKHLPNVNKIEAATVVIDVNVGSLNIHLLVQEQEMGQALEFHKGLINLLGFSALFDPKAKMLHEAIKNSNYLKMRRNVNHWVTRIPARQVDDWISTFFGIRPGNK